ncbi:MAG: RNA-splicing ligase RtcB [Candidatus Ryanbacteria bacterium RIFCSPHIGHO2_02_FULL_45_43]|uniref:tRNA-splicing ligase RtcB n=1 Tax=Candidatus Ryanbacteria bacterium RIFCSPHIGHO2_01_45_13 TaxID=1802112 RepID=A0A1G2G1Q0_9BACT|nr:MAG: RNA-splicing ligase RtcB [Candidatus Ryanbacteria bacterium RIFCSPHIGHO2_01_FULL_44_130]OGZ43761.1 MAG: RNA-splicing ligase RtcB [Candidatus Ryanbacteria bacterium RIFCSPHIGHO2_01_45_13]OGZ47703.1 MAG: RNA-splicing ligase RtcB [Candidatus Ryanbacteria bacterium RIFCSPHIGHO2_02_FULL_45_43]OGZ49599.1 MAG: RNA-splicing ligase RtcB [Candidatus Ryanbacteria bacterium RIFCSPHIGHO2_12_FULL_44_20]OGZ51281.1 MAG: RNA-splicing ligase RtcB [Candidatus Ryanbacteria bacterium RIFCSPLOWO2_01_FULL_44_
MFTKKDLKRISDILWEIPKSYRSDMRVPARLYSSEKMLEDIFRDRSVEQLVNVSTLLGIQKYAIAMPDIHEGYGFPIGGVAAFDVEEGIISPGSVGYDINCGVRLLRSEKSFPEVKPALEALGLSIYQEVPSGVGRSGRLKLKGKDLDSVLMGGAQSVIAMGYGEEEDMTHVESEGWLEHAAPDCVSERAKKRGHDQLGTMGAGNHFVEVGRIERIFDKTTAQALHLFENQVTILIHTGSRGLGHQVATDYITTMMKVMPKYGITLPDRELACAPFRSDEGKNYFSAMAASANFAWANRQLITHEVRHAWNHVFGQTGGTLHVVYDVAHNIAKLEEHEISQEKKNVVVHRKGATRAFPNQPVLIPGSMGTASYVLIGGEKSLEESFGSTCHGAGRRMSRTQARKTIRGSVLKEELKQQGIVINAGSFPSLAEEAPSAYKDVDAVVDVVHQAGIAKKVARLRPIAVIKG